MPTHSSLRIVEMCVTAIALTDLPLRTIIELVTAGGGGLEGQVSTWSNIFQANYFACRRFLFRCSRLPKAARMM